MSNVEDRLHELNLQVPGTSPAVGSYVGAVQTGNLVITSGQLPFVGKEITFKGKTGKDVTEQQASDAAILCILNALAHIKSVIGDLDKVKRIVRVDGYVNSAPGFTMQPNVMNEASDLLAKIFGTAGQHSRIAVGVSELPLNACVEVAVWAEV